MGETALDEVMIVIDFSGMPINGKRERTNSANHSIAPLVVIFDAFPGWRASISSLPSLANSPDEFGRFFMIEGRAYNKLGRRQNNKPGSTGIYEASGPYDPLPSREEIKFSTAANPISRVAS